MERMNEHTFYVLKCSDGTMYAGYTNDLDKRVRTHNEGKGAKYTRPRTPVTCIYSETHETKTEAMRAEYAFKQLSRSAKLKFIADHQRGEVAE